MTTPALNRVPSSYHGWIMMIAAIGEPPQAWQLRRLQGVENYGNNCEGCGNDAHIGDDGRSFYRTLNISDPDGMDPQVVYCGPCLDDLWLRFVNNHKPITHDFLTYMWKPALPATR